MTQYSSFLRGPVAGSTFLSLFALTAFTVEQVVKTPSVDTRTWVLMDYASGEVLAEGNADGKLDSVSPAKIMTNYMIGQALEADKIKLTGMVTAGKDTWAMGNPTLCSSSVMFFRSGDQVPVADLSKGVIIQFGNGACVALADYIAGSRGSFIGLTNGYTKKLGLTNTIFQTVHSLDAPGQLGVARDMALLGKALIRDVPKEYAIHKEEEFTFNKTRQPNHNRLLQSSDLNVDGMRTRTTTGAGYNPVISATQGDMRLASIVLEAKTDRIRFNESGKLLTWGFRSSEAVTLTKLDATFVTQYVWSDDKSKANLGISEASLVIIPRGQLKNLKASYTLMEPWLTAPLEKGQAVGTIDFQLNGKSIEQYPLIVMENIEEGGFSGRIRDFMMMKFHQWSGNWFS